MLYHENSEMTLIKLFTIAKSANLAAHRNALAKKYYLGSL